MKWNNLKPDISASSIAKVAVKLTAIDMVKLIFQTAECPLVILSDHVRAKIMKHLLSKRVELGGLLIGRVVSIDDLSKGLVSVNVKDSIESNDFHSTSVSLCMNTTVWQSASYMCDTETFVVGWYHSHPNLGAFFSGVDKKTQRDFFNSTFNLGLVIDPIRNEEKWFIGPDSTEVNLANVRSNFYGLEMV
jgi:proteasome lid subunit RPN8/RPN11